MLSIAHVLADEAITNSLDLRVNRNYCVKDVSTRFENKNTQYKSGLKRDHMQKSGITSCIKDRHILQTDGCPWKEKRNHYISFWSSF